MMIIEEKVIMPIIHIKIILSIIILVLIAINFQKQKIIIIKGIIDIITRIIIIYLMKIFYISIFII